MKLTHKQKILALFQANEGKEINHRQIIDSAPNGLGISEYSGRITDLRRDMGCLHGEGLPCPAREHIINTRKNYYVYQASPRRGVQVLKNPQPPAPLLPPKVVKLEGEALTKWNQTLEVLKGKRVPESFEYQVSKALL